MPILNGIAWFEVGTDNPAQAERFYGDVFGWTVARAHFEAICQRLCAARAQRHRPQLLDEGVEPIGPIHTHEPGCEVRQGPTAAR